MSEEGGAALTLAGVVRTFTQGESRIEVLKGIDLAVRRGETVALTGPSGSGKSTLLHIAGLLERPDGGEVHITGQACGRLSDRERTTLRRATLGFIYQFHHLQPEFSALENVMLPQMIAGRRPRLARERARALLSQLGLSERESHRPARLSGGEQQRVAIARALANSPVVILADEPTGNLDDQTAGAVFDSLRRLVRETGVAALIATHNPDLARSTDRWLAIEGGRIVPQS